MTVPNVTPAAGAAPSDGIPPVTSSILAAPAVQATDPAQQVVATVTEPVVLSQTTTTSQTVTPDAIERARQQEKDKLYGQLSQRDERMTAMEAELTTLRAEREAKAATEAAAQAALDEAARLKAIAETSAKDLVLQQQTEWEARFAAMQAERELERAELAKEAEFNRLAAYIQEQVRINSGDIAPQLFDFVNGNTPEEVDQSIELMKAKTAQILDSVTTAQQTQRSQMRGVSPTAIPGSGADELSGGTRQLTIQQLQDMPLSEYKKYRSQLGVTGNSTNKNRGLFD